jgi:hypothetical protein
MLHVAPGSRTKRCPPPEQDTGRDVRPPAFRADDLRPQSDQDTDVRARTAGSLASPISAAPSPTRSGPRQGVPGGPEDTRERESLNKSGRRTASEDKKGRAVARKIKSKMRTSASRKERDTDASVDTESPPSTAPKRRSLSELTPRAIGRRRSRARAKSRHCPGGDDAAHDHVTSEPGEHGAAVDGRPSTAGTLSSPGAPSDCTETFDSEESDGDLTGAPLGREISVRSLRFARSPPTGIAALLSPRRKAGGARDAGPRASPAAGASQSAIMQFEGVLPEGDARESVDSEASDPVAAHRKANGRGPRGLPRRSLLRRRVEKAGSPAPTSGLDSDAHDLQGTRPNAPSTTADTADSTSPLALAELGAALWLNGQLKLLGDRLTESEEELRALVETSRQSEERFLTEIARFKQILGTVDHAQELRYHSLLDVFTDNFKTMGTVEARFEQLLGVRHRQMQTSGWGRMLQLLWVVVDFAVGALFRLLHLVSESQKFWRLRRLSRASGGGGERRGNTQLVARHGIVLSAPPTS